MENFFSRYKNPLVLMAVLFIQVIALATQVKRAENPKAANSGGTRLIRVWTVTAIAPFERALVSTGHFFRNTWHNYIDLHNVRKQNLELQEEVARLKMEQVRLREDAHQAQRLQALLDFKEHYVGQVLPAQVIGTSGTELSRVISIDRGSRDGIRQDMPVITPDGIVGKVKEVFPLSSQVLMINDRESGAGVILQNSRLQGILRGTAAGELNVSDIMADEKVEVGEPVVTSGGDRIYPRGVPVGNVASIAPDRENDPFLAVKIKPAADLNRLEEVLVVTKVTEQAPAVAASPVPQRAADILAERLPSVSKPATNAGKPAIGAASGTGPANTAVPPQPQSGAQSGSGKKPETPLGLQKAGQESEQKKAAKPGVEQKKTAGPNPASAIAGQSTAPAPAVPGPAGSGNAAAPKPKPKPTPLVITPPSDAGMNQAKSAPATQVKKPKSQASPLPAVTPPQSEATKPGSEQQPAPVGERPPR